MKVPQDIVAMLLLTLICLDGTTGSSAGAPRHRVPPELYHQMLEAQLAASKADEALYEDMQLVASQLSLFVTRNGRFPEPGPESTAVSRNLGHSLVDNPYFSDAMLALNLSSNGTRCDPAGTGIRIEVDLGLCPNSAHQLSQNGLPDSFKASPGTITIIHNTEDTLLVWGAGIDGKPIRNPKSGLPYVVIKHFTIR